MGWVAFAALACAGLLVLWRSRVAVRLWAAVGAAIALAGAGYALQSHAGLAGHPVRADRTPMTVPEEEVELRSAMLGRSTVDWAYLVLSDGLFRAGRSESATQVLLSGINQYPDSVSLWTALGSALARHDGGQVSPASKLAFARARQLNPLHPAPPFFAGLAYIRAGDFGAARAQWARALVLTPRDISYRRDVELRLALLDRFIAETGASSRPR